MNLVPNDPVPPVTRTVFPVKSNMVAADYRSGGEGPSGLGPDLRAVRFGPVRRPHCQASPVPGQARASRP
jgi:hypothetical protein